MKNRDSFIRLEFSRFFFPGLYAGAQYYKDARDFTQDAYQSVGNDNAKFLGGQGPRDGWALTVGADVPVPVGIAKFALSYMDVENSLNSDESLQRYSVGLGYWYDFSKRTPKWATCRTSSTALASAVWTTPLFGPPTSVWYTTSKHRRKIADGSTIFCRRRYSFFLPEALVRGVFCSSGPLGGFCTHPADLAVTLFLPPIFTPRQAFDAPCNRMRNRRRWKKPRAVK